MAGERRPRRPRPSDQAVLRWIEQFQRSKGFPPTRREMAEHFGVSLHSIQRVIGDLADDGIIDVVPGGARSISVTRAGMKTITEPM